MLARALSTRRGRGPCSAVSRRTPSRRCTAPMSSSVGDGADLRLPRYGWPVAARRLGGDRRGAGRGRARSTAARSRPACGCDSLDRAAEGRRCRARPRARRGRRIAGARLPARVARAYAPLPARARGLQGRPRRRGRGAVDARGVAREPGPCTWSALRGDRRRRARSRPRAGCPSGRSSWSASSTSPTRPVREGDVHPVWAYAPRPQRLRRRRDRGADRAQIERFAPGLRERIVARAVRSTAELEAHNANYVGGDIITGANTAVPDPLPAPRRARPLRHRHPRCVHLLGGDPARRRARTGCAATTPPSRCCEQSE